MEETSAMTMPPPPILGTTKLNGLETQMCLEPQVCFFLFFVLILLTAIIYRFLIMIYTTLGTNGTEERKKKGEGENSKGRREKGLGMRLVSSP